MEKKNEVPDHLRGQDLKSTEAKERSEDSLNILVAHNSTTHKCIQSHTVEQSKYKYNISKLPLITIKLHPAGGFDKKTGLVYEPIEDYKYLFKFQGYKGLGQAENVAMVPCSSCGTIIKVLNGKTNIRCSCGRSWKHDVPFKWKLITEFDNLDLEFEGEPLKKTIFKTPRSEAVEYWLYNYLLNEKGEEIDEKYLFSLLKKYYRLYYDLPLERSYDIIPLAIFQSWLTEILDIEFYLTITGCTGSGKTALEEGIIELCKHGLMAGDIKGAGIARSIQKYKLSIGLDEVDTKKNQEDNAESICRQGYRRGQKYIRMAPNSHEPEFFDIFGFKCFTFRSDISDDLQNRSIEISMEKTNSQELPILNLFKQNLSPYELLFFWYLDNINYLYTKTPNFEEEQKYLTTTNTKLATTIVKDVNTVNIINNVNVNIYNSVLTLDNITRSALTLKTRLLTNYVNSINKKPIFGRNVEIGYLIYSLTYILGIDFTEVLSETIEQKQEIEEASQEDGWLGVLREVLIEGYHNRLINCNRDGVIYISYKDVISRYIRRMKDTYNNIPSQFQIKKLLRQIGFIDGINRKVMRVDEKTSLSLIYDTQIRKSLGIIEVLDSEKINSKITLYPVNKVNNELQD